MSPFTPLSLPKHTAHIINTVLGVSLVILLCSCSKQPEQSLESKMDSKSSIAVETLLAGRWHYSSYDIVVSSDHRFEVVAEPGYPGDVHKPPTGTWRIAGNKLIQKYDQNGFEEWIIDSITTGNLHMTSSGSGLKFRRVGSFSAPNPDALEAKAQRELTAPSTTSPSAADAATNSSPVGDAVSRLLIGEWGDENNTVYRYNADHSLTFSNKEFPSARYNNKGTWRLEGNRLVHILKNNETELRTLVSITADKMVAVEDALTWELAHLTPIAGADAGTLASLERAAEDQLNGAHTSQKKRVTAAPPTPRETPDALPVLTPPPEPSKPTVRVEGPADSIIAEKLKSLGMGNEEYKRGALLVSTGGQIPIGTTLYPIRLTRLAAAGPTVSDFYFFEDEFGEWKCLWRKLNRVF